MGSILTPEDKAEIQIALAEAFVDNEVDYAYIAERIQKNGDRFIYHLEIQNK